MRRLIYIFFLSIILILPLNVKAISCIKGSYNADITIDKDKLYVNDETKIKISSNSDYIIEYSVNDDNILTVNSEGVIKALSPGNGIINIIIYYTLNDNVIDYCTTNIPISISNHNLFLDSLIINEYDLSDIFKSDIYNYEIELPYSNKEINISGIANDEDISIVGLGKKELNVGLNVFPIILKDESSSITYTLSVTRKNANTDSTLKNLIVEGYILNPHFSKDTFNYTLEVDKVVNDIFIKAIANDKNSKITGSGNFDLVTGKNIFPIVVMAEDGSSSTYNIEVNKNKGNSLLKDLKIKDFNLDTPFQSDKFIYNLVVDSNISSIQIEPVVNDEDQVEILPNSNLNYGKNEILIRVTGTDKTSTTYKLIVNRMNDKKSNINIVKILLITFIILIIIVVVLAVVLFINFKKRNMKIKKIKKDVY